MRMLLQKIGLSFLRASSWTRTQSQEDLQSEMLLHVPAHALFLSWTQSQLYTHRKEKKRGLATFLHSLAGDPEAEPGEERDTARISCPRPSALANEKRGRPIWFHCEQTLLLSWLRDSECLECCGRCFYTTRRSHCHSGRSAHDTVNKDGWHDRP